MPTTTPPPVPVPLPMPRDREVRREEKAFWGKEWVDSPPKLKVLEGGCFERIIQSNLGSLQEEDNILVLSGCLSRQRSYLLM